MSWVRKISHPSEMLSEGDKVKCVILSVDQDRKRVALGLKLRTSTRCNIWCWNPSHYQRATVPAT
jgi:ribosomal protein S1